MPLFDRPGLERAPGARRVTALTVVGLLLLPLVLSGGFLWATWNSDTRLDRVAAAVVNLDEPVTIDGQPVPLGRQLAGGLVDSDEEQFSWTLTDEEDATAGLESGRYAAVVTIPRRFSADATSFSRVDSSGAEPEVGDLRPATVEVQTSQQGGIADPLLSQAITAAATRALSTELTERYLDGIYLGFNEVGEQFETIADAASQLSNGAGELSSGLDRTADGAGALAVGLNSAGNGAGQLADGAGELSTGARQLSSGASQLGTGATQLSTGATQLGTGTDQLAEGLDRLADGAAGLPRGTRQLATGAAASADGADEITTGIRGVSGGLSALRYGTRQDPRGLDDYLAGADRFADGLDTYADTVGGLATVSDDAQLARHLPEQARCPYPEPAQCAIYYDGLRAGTGLAASGLTTRAAGQQASLTEAARGLVTGAEGIDEGVGELITGTDRLATGSGSLATGLDRLATGADRLADGVPALVGGIRASATGAEKLSDGADGVATGARGLARGANQLSTGAGGAADGAAELSTGVRQLATGIDQSVSGAEQLDSGLVRLADGGDQLSEGAGELADGLADGKDEIPSYGEQTRERLSEVAATPVEGPAADSDSILPEAASATVLTVVALWVGGLATYLVLRAVPADVLSSMRSSARLALGALLPGAAIAVVQAAALAAILTGLLDLSAGQVARALPFTVLAGAAFVAVNHALAAWFGGVGRFLSVVMVVIVAAGSLTSAVPAALDAVRPFLPLAPALDGLRAIAADSGGAGGSAALLGAWLLVAVAVSVLAVARRRVVPALVPAPVTS